MSKNCKLNNIFKLILFTCLISLSMNQYGYSVCNKDNCPPSRGVCSNNNQCICNKNYITVDNQMVKSNGQYCNYYIKSKYMALLLEFFFPFGVGHFYSGKTLLAIIKLTLFIILVCACCSVLCCVAGKVVNACSIIISILVVLCLVGLVLMEIFDLVGYGFGIYTDGNGITLG